MATPVMMPKQGQSVESCIISQWYKKKGDAVKAGDLLFSYETDKASFEEEAKVDGILLEIFYNEGDEVPVLYNVAVIGSAGESTDEFRPGGTSVADSAPVVASPVVSAAPVSENTATPVAGDTKIRVSPRARSMAEKKGINLSTLKGTGPNGRIIVRDVEALTGNVVAAEPVQPVVAKMTPAAPVVEYSNEEHEVKKLSNIRKLIAKAMHESLQNSAQLTHHMGADVRKLLAFREQVKKSQKADPNYPNITLNDMVCWAVIRALEKFPEANSQFLGDSIKTFKQVHLGLAVDTPRGLMVPVLKNADNLSLKGLSNNLRTLAEACRKGNVDPELLKSTMGSFTVSNLGNYGVEVFTPIINVPQVAILGVNTIVHRPADIGGGVMAFVPYIGLSLTYDHRAIDGGPATLFLREIKMQIENFDVAIS
ncbi:MAG: 2-oxo acid dehydrogenase subunit E2 [Bacteroidales bacterium]|jgi:pyruvate dehydrogenase E2 component (dihydrolipoamide acetyltransferase)|nr:2-oxo acid dehydrogenase subunit E2 [Bacteroidales bacterium]